MISYRDVPFAGDTLHTAMDITTSFSYTVHCPPQLSENGAYIAYVTGDRLVVRSSSTLATKRIINLPEGFGRRVASVRWDQCVLDSDEQRLAVVTGDEVLAISVTTGQGHSTTNESKPWGTILPGKEGATDVEWKSCLYENEAGTRGQIVRIVVFSKLALRVSIWSSDGIELNLGSPKVSKCLSLQPNSEYVSVLTRDSTVDTVKWVSLTKLASSSRSDAKNLVRQVALETMLDVKDVKWSPSGLYIAAIDTPLMGYKACVYAIDGTLLGKYTHGKETGEYGCTTLQWLRARQEEVVLIGDQKDCVTGLSLFNYRSIFELKHGIIEDSETSIWIESESNEQSQLIYELTQTPFRPPTVQEPSFSSPDVFISGVSWIKVSPTQAYVATKVESMPTTVWIWDMELHDTPVLSAVLCHSSIIRHVEWSQYDTLMVIPEQGSLVGLWNANSRPLLADWSSVFGSITGASWIEDGKLVVWDDRTFAVGSYTTSIDQDREASPQLLRDDEDPNVRDIVNGVQQMEWTEDPENINLEDTFHGIIKT